LVLADNYKIVIGASENNLNSTDKKAFQEWISVNWKAMLKTLKLLLSKEIDESLTQNILNNLQNLINLTGSISLPQARDSALMALCQGCLPNGIPFPYFF
jgi:hypothetical protein